MDTKNYKRYFQFLLIVVAAGSIFPLLYLKTNYQETLLEVYGITLIQLNGIFSVLGVASLLGYFPSGWLADRFSAKKLIFISLLICGLTGLWFAQVPSYPIVILIFIIWGIFTIFTFWAAHLKLVKLISKKEEEGRFFGALDGGRGVVEAILASIALFIFTSVLGGSTEFADKKEALISVVYMYSAMLILVSFLILFFVKEDKPSSKKEESLSQEKTNNKINVSDIKEIFSNKFVWLLGGIIFMSYIVAWSVYYQGGFLQTNVKIDAATVGKVTVIMLWMRPIGGFLGGFLGDKFGKSSILIIALGLASTFLITISLSPVTLPHIYFNVLVVLIGLAVYTIRGLYWSLLGDCNINEKILGLAIGCISFIGYFPDIIIPNVNIWLFKTYGDNGGYNAYFIFCASAGILAILITLIFKMAVKKNNKNLIETAE
ncbi:MULTISPECIES: MFS transporter [Bacillaceae]|uniref:MFS transporter n=1 Tax=Domibacillus aminovorans TaxID=29332 RepID=A0A177KLP3_9BACI|nr:MULTISPECIES: MFS transporter [Bacillaceae]OAH54292.1 MFS transporter [Domibacillus aminovorans]